MDTMNQPTIVIVNFVTKNVTLVMLSNYVPNVLLTDNMLLNHTAHVQKDSGKMNNSDVMIVITNVPTVTTSPVTVPLVPLTESTNQNVTAKMDIMKILFMLNVQNVVINV